MSDIITHFHQEHENFTLIPYSFFQIDYLKPDEKYLLMWIKSRPPGFKINTKGLATHLKVGKDTIVRISKNLQSNNHLVIKRLTNGSAEWHFFQNPEQCKLFSSPLDSPYTDLTHAANQKPHSEKPHAANPTALTSIDPLTNIDQDKTLCSSKNELIESEFDRLWEVWPAKKNKIASRKAFKSVVKGKSPDTIKTFVNKLISDAQERLKANEYAFDKRNLEKHLKNELYHDPIVYQQGSVNPVDDGSEKARKEFEETKKRFNF